MASEINCAEKITKPVAIAARTGQTSGFHPDSPEVSPMTQDLHAYSTKLTETHIIRGTIKKNKMLKSRRYLNRTGIREYKKSILMCALFRVTNAIPNAKCAPVSI